MKIVIIGLGYVGSTAAGCLVSQGHRVIGVDVSLPKVEAFNRGEPPVFEPGLKELFRKGKADGLLSAQTEICDWVDNADLVFVCVGTPSAASGGHDMRYIVQSTREIANALKGMKRDTPLTVAYRSTIRPGTVDELIVPIFRSELGDTFRDQVEVVYNPEFLREASAISDFFNPPKIVVGTLDGEHCKVMEEVNRGIDAPIFVVPVREAEIIKFVDNTWHAVKVTFANEIGRICQKLKISARTIHEIFVSDHKLNISSYYLRPGAAFGGSCLPKDVRAFQNLAMDCGANLHLVDSLTRSNEAHKHHQFEQITHGRNPSETRILLIGLTFKTGTDDLRESPAIDLARKLLNAGYSVDVYDPFLAPEALIGQNLGYAYSHLPELSRLLIARQEAESNQYSIVVVNNNGAEVLSFSGQPAIIDISSIP